MTGIKVTRRTVVGGIAATAALAALPATASEQTEPSFLVVGDWGRHGTQHQRDVAVQMGKTASAMKSRFILSVGDNFYENGVQSATDPQWKSSFEDIYTDSSLAVPWHVVLGNHDYRGNPQAQIDYAATSQRWRMPSRYRVARSEELGIPGVDLFIIDTSPLVHSYRERVETAIAGNVASQDVAAQLSWLDRELGASSARWKIVTGHHTIRSGGSGHGDTPEMVALVKPLLEKHNVRAYINGHDHDLQHLRDNGVDYVCCGAGSEVRPVRAVDGTLFCLERSGFASISVVADRLNLEFRDYLGASVYQAAIMLA